MKRWMFLMSLLALLVACSGDDGVERSYWDNGELKSELRYKDGKLDGECLWYTEEGKLEKQCWYKDGLLDSIYRSYSAKGNLASEEHYVKGKLNGEFRKWYDNG